MANLRPAKIDADKNLKESEAVMDSARSATYEYERDKETRVHISPDKVNNCSMHFHNQVEIIAVQTSQQLVQINNEQTILHAGEMAVADSFDVHSYTYCDAVSTVLIIPDAYLHEYKLYKQDMSLRSHFIRDKKVYDACFPLLKQIAEEKNTLLQRGLIDVLLGRIVSAVGLVHAPQSSRQDVALIHDILTYIEKHYAENITLQSVAATFSYSSSHFSRLFNAFFHCNIKDYINTVRLRKFFELREASPDKSLIELILESGFSSVPTFYRLFSKKLGMSPFKYFNAEKAPPPPPYNS